MIITGKEIHYMLQWFFFSCNCATVVFIINIKKTFIGHLGSYLSQLSSIVCVKCIHYPLHYLFIFSQSCNKTLENYFSTVSQLSVLGSLFYVLVCHPLFSKRLTSSTFSLQTAG